MSKDAPRSARVFAKRVFTPGAFLRCVGWLVTHAGAMRASSARASSARGSSARAPSARAPSEGPKPIDPAFTERIMLAVTGVNDCRYCTYAHTKMGLRAGLSADELRGLLSGDFRDAPDDELPALLFAQHYAENGGRLDPEAWDRLRSRYGPETAAAILVRIRMIWTANLLGNTLDAFLARFRGRKVAHSSPVSELAVLLLVVLLVPLLVPAVAAAALVRALTVRLTRGRGPSPAGRPA